MTTREIYLVQLRSLLSREEIDAKLRELFHEEQLSEIQRQLARIADIEAILSTLSNDFFIKVSGYNDEPVSRYIKTTIYADKYLVISVYYDGNILIRSLKPKYKQEEIDDFLDDLKRGVFFDTFEEPELEPATEKEESCSQCSDGFDIDFDEIDPEDLQFVQKFLNTEEESFQPTFHNCVFNINLS